MSNEIQAEWYPRAQTQLQSLRDPARLNEASRVAAEELLSELSSLNLKPRRIMRTAEDLVSIWVSLDEFRSRVEVCDDGKFVLSVFSLEPITHIEFPCAASVCAAIWLGAS